MIVGMMMMMIGKNISYDGHEDGNDDDDDKVIMMIMTRHFI